MKVEESTCDYGSRGFLKLAGPLSGFLIGCWVNLGVPPFVLWTLRRSGCPALGDVTAGEHRGWSHGGGVAQGRPGVAMLARTSGVCRRPCVCVHTDGSV